MADKVYCYGNADNGNGVISKLESHGGVNSGKMSGRVNNVLYFIDKNGNIACTPCDTTLADIVIEFYTEVKPLSTHVEYPTSLIVEFKKNVTESVIVRSCDSTEMHTMSMLIAMKDRYNGKWSPDWKSSDKKYCITCVNGEVKREYLVTRSAPLAFKDVESRDAFYTNFKDKIEICKFFL